MYVVKNMSKIRINRRGSLWEYECPKGGALRFTRCYICNEDCEVKDMIDDLKNKDVRTECEVCGMKLDLVYISIIWKLKKLGLLPNSFPYLCCNHREFYDFGFFDK